MGKSGKSEGTSKQTWETSALGREDEAALKIYRWTSSEGVQRRGRDELPPWSLPKPMPILEGVPQICVSKCHCSASIVAGDSISTLDQPAAAHCGYDCMLRERSCLSRFGRGVRE
ncbi:hypothetical protein COOONC_21786 [Cooperia oncophora]